VAAALGRDGIACSGGLVADLMRELGLQACQPRAYKRTTVPGEQPVHSPDLVAREFSADAPGTRLVDDITYLRTGEGWLCLATVSDLATRMVVGWQTADHLRTSLVVDAGVHGDRPRICPAGCGVPQRPRLSVHLGPVHRVLCRQPSARQCGTHRCVL
jgi:transposase InsO family protein